jgi:hypothetical protein
MIDELREQRVQDTAEHKVFSTRSHRRLDHGNAPADEFEMNAGGLYHTTRAPFNAVSRFWALVYSPTATTSESFNSECALRTDSAEASERTIARTGETLADRSALSTYEDVRPDAATIAIVMIQEYVLKCLWYHRRRKDYIYTCRSRDSTVSFLLSGSREHDAEGTGRTKAEHR